MSTPQSGQPNPQEPQQGGFQGQNPQSSPGQPGSSTPGYNQYGYQQSQPGPQYPQTGAYQPGQQGPYQQGQPGYAYAAPVRPTNTYAIISLVSSFFIAVVGVIFGHLARKQIRETGEAGDGLAIAGLIIGYVHIGFWVIFGLLFAIPFFMALPMMY
ncbi:hypothetical protein GCM10027591_14550 [Zhihengliuella somnathii]